MTKNCAESWQHRDRKLARSHGNSGSKLGRDPETIKITKMPAKIVQVRQQVAMQVMSYQLANYSDNWLLKHSRWPLNEQQLEVLTEKGTHMQCQMHHCSKQNKHLIYICSVPDLSGSFLTFPCPLCSRKLYENKTVNIDSLLTVYRIAGNIGDL